MNEEEKKLLEENLELSKENHEMLLKIRSIQKREQFFSILKWVVIIGLGVGSFYFIQPYIEVVKEISSSFQETFGGMEGTLKELKNLPNMLP